jgi:hypothetical protein
LVIFAGQCAVEYDSIFGLIHSAPPICTKDVLAAKISLATVVAEAKIPFITVVVGRDISTSEHYT